MARRINRLNARAVASITKRGRHAGRSVLGLMAEQEAMWSVTVVMGAVCA
jgi:hypothetical protein